MSLASFCKLLFSAFRASTSGVSRLWHLCIRSIISWKATCKGFEIDVKFFRACFASWGALKEKYKLLIWLTHSMVLSVLYSIDVFYSWKWVVILSTRSTKYGLSSFWPLYCVQGKRPQSALLMLLFFYVSNCFQIFLKLTSSF